MDSGNTAWVLASAALVLFMTPGLAFFYGGMVRSKNVLGMLMQNFFCIGLVSVLWAVLLFSLAFGTDIGGGLLGGFDFVGLKDLGIADVAEAAENVPGLALTIPPLLFVAFQLMFAIITPALITGAIADRMKFRPRTTLSASAVRSRPERRGSGSLTSRVGRSSAGRVAHPRSRR